VRYAGEPTSDEEIAKRALGVLRWDSTVPDSVHLTVSKGWLTLTGEVTWQYQRNNAENALRHLGGIAGISNNITIKPRPQVGVIKQRIEEALRRSAEVEARQIRVDIKDSGTVMLDGKVDTWSERSAVERAAWSVPGVHSVVDRLDVG
jgi:osmotically-inducible protein OsmY